MNAVSTLAFASLLGLGAAAANAQAVTPTEPLILVDPEAQVEELRRYSVEVIIFEYASSASAGNEVFAPEEVPTTEVDPLAASALADESAPAAVFGDFIDSEMSIDPTEDEEIEEIVSLSSVEFRRLHDDEKTMGDIHERLRNLDAYKPVAWGGWSQVVAEQATTPNVHVRLLGNLPLDYEGHLTLYLKNYLHLVVDIDKREEISSLVPRYRQQQKSFRTSRSSSDFGFEAVDTQSFVYEISEDRIFRSGQLRYFDHPKFGVLVRVIRVEDPLDNPEQEQLSESDGAELLSSEQR